jgi:hypothetical protein
LLNIFVGSKDLWRLASTIIFNELLHVCAIWSPDQIHVEITVNIRARKQLIKSFHHSALLLRKQIISCGDVVVLVDLQATNCIVSRKTECIHFSEHILFETILLWSFMWFRRLRYLPIPGMSPNHGNGETFGGIRGQKTCDQILDAVTYESWRMIVCCQNLFVEGSRVLILKRQISTNQGKEDDTATPQITQRRHIAMPRDHFRSCIARRTTCSLEFLPIPVHVAQSEVHYLNVFVVVEKEVLRLQIAMDYVHRMNLLHSCKNLVKEAACFRFLHPTIGHNVVEELTTTRIFHQEIQLPSGLNDLIQLHHVWMADELQNVHFASHTFHISHVNNALLFKNLHSHTLTSEYVCAEFYLSERSFTDSFA